MDQPHASGLGRKRFLRLSAAAAGTAALAGIPGTVRAGASLHCAPPAPPGPPTPWAGDPRAIQTRPSAYALSAAYLTKLKNAYAAMRALPASDPRSFVAQGNIHGWWCGGCGDGMMAPGGGVHFHWTFFLWHRAYLYFHERILGSLIGDPTFRLPYWDWDNAAHLAMPSGFTSPASSANSLWNGTRTLSGPIPAFGVDSSVMNAINALTTWDPFGGDTGSGGAVENQPHGFVHVHVGGDMGSFGSAGQDPIFYAHHCNVDKVWAHWRDALSRPQPPPGYFGSTTWTFYDENKKWTSIKPTDVLDHEAQLRYRYTGGLVLASPFPHFTLGPFKTPIPHVSLAPTHIPIPNITVRPIGPWPPFKLPGPDPVAQITEAQRAQVLGAVQQGARVAVAFQNITVPQGATGIIDIVDANNQRVGYIAIVPDTPDGKTMHSPRVTAVVEVTKTAERVFAANAAPQLRLAPSALTRGVRFNAIPIRATAAHVVAF